MKTHSQAQQRGFTLLETMIAGALLFIGLVGATFLREAALPTWAFHQCKSKRGSAGTAAAPIRRR